MDAKKARERSVDSLQRVYAFLISLAIAESMRRLILSQGNGALEFHFSHLPSVLALVVTLVPYYHGMNRHLDVAYVSGGDTKGLSGSLLFDFMFFFAEAAVLFALAVMVTTPVEFSKVIAALFLVDAAWGAITNFISDGMGWRWAVLNLGAGLLTLLFAFQRVVTEDANPWAIFAIAGLRSLVDYWWCWDFYFPSPPKTDQTVRDTAQ